MSQLAVNVTKSTLNITTSLKRHKLNLKCHNAKYHKKISPFTLNVTKYGMKISQQCKLKNFNQLRWKPLKNLKNLKKIKITYMATDITCMAADITYLATGNGPHKWYRHMISFIRPFMSLIWPLMSPTWPLMWRIQPIHILDLNQYHLYGHENLAE